MTSETYRIDYSGSMVTWTVPRHVAGTLTAKVIGAPGGQAPRNLAGAGGQIGGTLNLSAGTILHVIAGAKAGDLATTTSPATAGGGPNLGGQGGDGGTNGNSNGAGGGGASEIRTSTSIGDRIMVAGGGGGAGTGTSSGDSVGAGEGGQGSASGISGRNDGDAGTPATGGSHAAAGAGGTPVYGTGASAQSGGNGSSGVGGAGADGVGTGFGYDAASGGGGGGGFYGGGAGGGGGDDGFRFGTPGNSGAGGSSWADAGVVSSINDVPSVAQAVTGDGWVEFMWEPNEPSWITHKFLDPRRPRP